MSKFLTVAAMCGTMLSPMIATSARADIVPAALADPANTATLDDMQDQCDLLAGAHDNGNGDEWSAIVAPGAVAQVGVTIEVAGSRDIEESTLAGIAGTFVPGHVYIAGEPYRVGGSVNMFGMQHADAGYWGDSTYFYNADFNSTFAHAFSCDIQQAVFHKGNPNAGHYIVRPSEHGNDDDNQQSCVAKTALGETWEHWGEDTQQCTFVSTPTPDFHDLPQSVGVEAGGVVNQDQVDTQRGFEDHGGRLNATGGDFQIGQVAICISPSKPAPGGTWRQQNGYEGGNCTTTYFKTAPYGGGSQTSNGTYISVPNYSY